MIADFKHVFAHRVMNVNTRLAKHGNGINGQPNKVCSECSHEGEIMKTNFEEEKNWEHEQRSYVRWGAWFVTHPQKLILRRLVLFFVDLLVLQGIEFGSWNLTKARSQLRITSRDFKKKSPASGFFCWTNNLSLFRILNVGTLLLLSEEHTPVF